MRRSISTVYNVRRLTSITAATADTSSWLIRAYPQNARHSFVTNLVALRPRRVRDGPQRLLARCAPFADRLLLGSRSCLPPSFVLLYLRIK